MLETQEVAEVIREALQKKHQLWIIITASTHGESIDSEILLARLEKMRTKIQTNQLFSFR